MSNVMSVPNDSSLNLTVLKHFETTLEIQTALECLIVAVQLKIRLIQKLLSGFSVWMVKNQRSLCQYPYLVTAIF